MNRLDELATTAAFVMGPFGIVAALLGTGPEPVSGHLEYKWQEVRAVELVQEGPRHLAFAEGRGSYAGRGGDALDGSTVSVVETADTVRGLGSLRGYLVFEKDGSTAVARWSATLTENLADATGGPQSVSGSWTLVSGTGRLSAASGQGLLQGHRHGGRTTVTLTGSLSGTRPDGKDEPSVARPAASPAPASLLPGA